jgi:hypothetical protein
MSSHPFGATRRLRAASIAAGLALLVVLAVAPRVAAADEARRQLPELPVTALDGSAVAQDAVARSGHWLLAYVLPESAACRPVLRQLESVASASGSRLVLIVGAGAAGARALTEQYPGLSKATLYLDVAHGSSKALKLTGVPVVMGMRDRSIAWSLGGTPSDARTLASILETWLR